MRTNGLAAAWHEDSYSSIGGLSTECRKEIRRPIAAVLCLCLVACDSTSIQSNRESVEAEQTVAFREKKIRVAASLETVRIKKLRDPGRNEIYVIAMVADNRVRGNEDGDSTDDTLGQFTLSSSLSVVFKGIRNNEEISLSGDGLILYPNREPRGALGVCFSIVEQDKNGNSNLKAAQFLENVGDSITKNTNANVSNLLVSATESIIRYYKKDDILFTHCHSGFSHNSYGISSESKSRIKTQSIVLDKEKVRVVLKLTVTT